MDDTNGEEQRKTPEGARSSREALVALQTVYVETEALYQQSSMFVEQVHGQGELSMGRRNLLLALLHSSAQTVPQMARSKSVSRQYIQKLVNQLGDEGLVEFVDNAAHKRSHLVQLTQKGKEYITAMLQREVKIIAQMVIDIPAERLQETAQMLRTIRVWQKSELQRLLQEPEG
ncbi:MAG TPA: hypothetical protein VGU68_00610 [Ktedonobacteraceae bacterium]|nr:hypothetical protein [Ktedonobacteraceae bacterium]